MKRWMKALCMSVVLMSAACGSGSASVPTEAPAETAAAEETSAPEETAAPAETSAQTETSGGVLVVYFSRTGEQYGVGVIDKGNTEIVAEIIAEKTGADLYEVRPAEDNYPDTYDALCDVAKQEQNENARPAIADPVPDLSGYDTVFIGAPVWWGDWPMIMYTFFEENAAVMAGKTLIPFSTHGGSGLSGFDRKLEKACPDSTVGEGIGISGEKCQNDRDGVENTVSTWLAGLGF